MPRRSRMIVKRAVDVVGAIGAGVLLSPIIVGIVVSQIGLKGSVLFVQGRPGRFGEPFTIYKFRTMTDDRCPDGELLPDSSRITPIGQLLRRWSLDELPELWNIVKGDMSLVGPRPLLLEYMSLYNDEQMRRHEMRPGLTGLAQVSGRNDQSWEERLALDVWYVDHWSLRLDAKILIMTVAKVLTGEGVAAPGSATMPRFEGVKHA